MGVKERSFLLTSGILLAVANNKAKTKSAVVSVKTPGVFPTLIDFEEQEGKSETNVRKWMDEG